MEELQQKVKRENVLGAIKSRPTRGVMEHAFLIGFCTRTCTCVSTSIPFLKRFYAVFVAFS